MTSYSSIRFNNAPPLGLYRLKQFLDDIDIPCDILDFGLSGYEDYLARAKQGEYQVIGMSVSHYHMKDDLSVISKFKEATKGQKCVFVAGGQEATYNYKNWIIAGIDVVFLGYAERNFARFCDRLRSDFDDGMKNLDRVDGIAFRQGKEFVFRPFQPLTQSEFEYLNYERVKDLNIPFEPYWQQIRDNSKDLNIWTTIFVTENVRLYTSSHCPNQCGFCSSHQFLSFSQQKKARIFMLNAKQVFDLILRYIQKDGARGFLFSDDEFLLDKRRVLELCDYIIEAKANGVMDSGVLFNCQARVIDFLVKTTQETRFDHELIDKMLSAGFHSVGLGVETFVDRLLTSPSMNKRGFQEKDTLLVLETLIEKGLIPQVNIILFIPEATREEVLYSVQRGIHFIRHGCQTAVTPLLYAVPGAPVSEDSHYSIKKENYINKETGELIEIMENFIPFDQNMARCADQIFEVFDQEVQSFKKSKLWEFHTIPKTMVGLIMLLSVSKLLKDDALAAECDDLIRDLISKQKQYVS